MVRHSVDRLDYVATIDAGEMSGVALQHRRDQIATGAGLHLNTDMIEGASVLRRICMKGLHQVILQLVRPETVRIWGLRQRRRRKSENR